MVIAGTEITGSPEAFALTPHTLGRPQRRNIGVTVNIVRPSMKQDDDGTGGGPGFNIADPQNARINLLERITERHES